MTHTTIHIIDDQEPVRTALSEMLGVFGFSVRAYESAEEFLAGASEVKTGCLVADVRMPGMDGIALVHEITRLGIPLPIILISGHADVPMAVEGIKAGATDFIEKPLDDIKLVAAINRGLAMASAQEITQKGLENARAGFARLTPRQIEVFDLVASGYTSHAIGERLGISQRTVESYRISVMEKMHAESVAALVRKSVMLKRS